MREKPLIKNANPVPDPAHEGLSERAAEELAALVGPGGATPTAAPRRSSRRGFVLAAVACGAAVAIGGVTLLGLESDPAGPARARGSWSMSLLTAARPGWRGRRT